MEVVAMLSLIIQEIFKINLCDLQTHARWASPTSTSQSNTPNYVSLCQFLTMPLLERLQIIFFHQLNFSVPHLVQFIYLRLIKCCGTYWRLIKCCVTYLRLRPLQVDGYEESRYGSFESR